METVEDILNFFNAAMIYGDKNLGKTDKFNQARSFVIYIFHETKHVEGHLLTSSIIKFIANDVEDVVDNVHDLRSNTIYMIRFEKAVKYDVDKVMN